MSPAEMFCSREYREQPDVKGRTHGADRSFGRRAGPPKGQAMAKNTICVWYDKDAEAAARFYAETFPDSAVSAVHRAPSDYPSGKKGDVLTVEFTVAGVACIGLNGGPAFKHNEAFSFQIATDDQQETDRYWNAIVGNGGEESACGWCKDRWGISWQITPRVLTEAMAAGGAQTKRAFAVMKEMGKSHAARRCRSQARVRRDDGNGKNPHREDQGRPPRLNQIFALGENLIQPRRA